MLYQLHETQRTALIPMVGIADFFFTLFSHPLSPFSYTPLSHPASAGYGLFKRIAQEYEKPAWDIRTIRSEDITIDVQQQELMKKPFCRLVHFKRSSDNPGLSKGWITNPLCFS